MQNNKIISNLLQVEIELLEHLIDGFDDKERFLADVRTQRAVVVTLTNIGELAKRYSQDYIANHGSIPWDDIIGLRNIAAHSYNILNMDDIWLDAQESVLKLKCDLFQIQNNDRGEPER